MLESTALAAVSRAEAVVGFAGERDDRYLDELRRLVEAVRPAGSTPPPRAPQDGSPGFPRQVVTPACRPNFPHRRTVQAVLLRITSTVSSGWSQCGKWPQLSNQCSVASGKSSSARVAWLGSVTRS